MCVSNTPGTPARDPAPGQATALGLQLGTTEIQRSQANVLGRLALTSTRSPATGITQAPGTSATVPAGTVGAAPGATNVAGGVGPATGRSPYSLGYGR